MQQTQPNSQQIYTADMAAHRVPGHVVGHILSFIGVTLLCVVLILFGIIFVMERGNSPTLTRMFVSSMRETSALRWIAPLFLTADELDSYLLTNTGDVETEEVNTSLIRVAEARAISNAEENVEVVNIAYGNCKGKMLIVRDSKSVILGTSGEFGRESGLLLTDMVAKYDGVGGINAGGFVDNNGLGNGGTPQGLVIADGKLVYGSPDARYAVVGLDGNGVLIVGNMKGSEALAKGVRWAVSFTTHDGVASSLIINGQVQTQDLGAGVNPRTAIGQREDGTLLLLCLDGRSIDTFGATVEDVCNIMLQYGAVNAGNLDGGSSSTMVYGGEIINNCASVTGPRRIPTGFIVLKEAYGNGDA